ncbi:TPA: Ig-like domain-containing protein [Enterobacter hormaechei subsp. hoffmannii]
MRKTLIGCMVATALATVSSAHAQVFSYSFTDTNKAVRNIKPATQTYLNPAGVLTLNLISGLDRYERVTVTRDSDKKVMYSSVSTKTSVADRIVAADGTEYYGKDMVLPALGEGTFTVVNETLDIRQTVVSTSTYHFIVDTTPPRYKSIYPSQNAGYDMVLSGPLWELGRGGSGQFSIFADGIEDASGIAKIRLVIKRSNGSVVSDNNLSYDTANKRAFYPWIKDMNTQAGMPSSDLDEEFTFNFIVTDLAGNTLNIPPQRFLYDDQMGEFTPFAVHDSRVSTSVVPGISSGYVPFKRGLTVLENPYKLVIRIPRTNWKPYRNGGMSITNNYGGVQVLSEDATYVYVEVKLPQGALDGNYYRPVNTYQWSGGDLGQYASWLNWDPASVKSPAWGSSPIERQKADGTWFNSVNWNLFKASDMPIKLTNIRFNVQARPYDQKITGGATCSIPAGSTTCTVSLPQDIINGTTGYLHSGYEVRSTTEATFFAPIWENIAWHTLGPSVTGFDYIETTNILQVYVNQPGDGSYFDHVYVNRVWLSDKNRNNAEISVTGKQTGRNMASGNYTYEFNMKEVPEGSYNVVINAQDTFNNTGNLPYQTVVVDNTAPSVSISYEGKPISKNVTVYGLENVRIQLTDALTKPSLSRMTLRGGPVSDAVELSWVNLRNNLYAPNYPKIFPSLNEGETYTLTVQAKDEMNNVKESSVEFNYLPNNLVRLENLKTLAVNASLKTSDNTPLAVLYASQLRKKDGSIATGLQDAVLTVRKDAAFGVTVNGVSAMPGESKELQLDLGLGDSRSFPIFPAVSGLTGRSEFMINIEELK